MGLDDLVGCIELLQERIRAYEATLRENETRTRMALIDPLLKALGWNPADPGVVTPEYKVSGGWADYALLRPDGKPASTVEAKKLGTPLADHRRQMLNYANESGIEYAGLTDGNHWEMYEIFQRGTLEERRILEVSIVSDPAAASALKLLILWRPNLVSDKPIPASPPILPASPPSSPPRAAPIKPDSPSRAPASIGWIALSEYDQQRVSASQCPGAIRFWDGSEQPLNYWYQILTSAVGKLYAEKRFTVEDLPIGWTQKIYIVNIEPVHPTGKPFANSKKIEGTPLFVNMNLSAPDVRRNTCRLLERYNQNPADVYLQVAQ